MYYYHIIGDFNHKVVEKDDKAHSMRKFAISERNDRVQSLIRYMKSRELHIMNICFKKKVNRKQTWRSPNETIKNEIGFIVIPEHIATVAIDSWLWKQHMGIVLIIYGVVNIHKPDESQNKRPKAYLIILYNLYGRKSN